MSLQQALQQLKEQIQSNPKAMLLQDVLSLIDEHYDFTPSQFVNGDLENAVDENQGSGKLLSFGLAHELTQDELLACFGQYYQEVLDDPQGDGHQNIRNFMQTSWGGVSFQSSPLQPKQCS